jgi:hypothetical protein
VHEFQLDNADVGALLRTVPEGIPWLLAVAANDWSGAQPGDRVRLWYAGDPATANPAYPAGEWNTRVRGIRRLHRAPEMSPADVAAVQGFEVPETEPVWASQIWQGLARGRDIHSVLLVSFDFD